VTHRLWAWAVPLGLYVSVASADAPAVSSVSSGYFLGYSGTVFLSSESSTEDLTEIQRVCARNGRLWVLGKTSQFECVQAKNIPNTHGGALELQIKNRQPQPAVNLEHGLLYSVKPFTAPTWIVRKPVDTDLSALRSEMMQKFKKYSGIFNPQRIKNATVVEPESGKQKFYILPWKTTDDGYVERKHFIIATFLEGRMTRVREHEGKVVAYADLDGDSVPELHLSHHCDGICDSVISMTRKTKSAAIIEISTH
jgi:hypothetical protein